MWKYEGKLYMNVIECKKISKSFSKKKVLDELDISFEEGKIYALLGRNGAGKTTLLNTIVTKYLPDSGKVELFGEEAYENTDVLKKVCFMSDSMSGFLSMTVKSIFLFAKSFYDNWDEECKDNLVEIFGIEEKKSFTLLSKGQQTAVALTVGMACGCPVVLFDEIYSGLDAVARKDFYNLLLNEYYDNSRTFVISTHLIDEMSNIFSDVAILDAGEIVLKDDIENIKRKSFAFTGRKEMADLFDKKNVVGTNEIGGLCEFVLYDDFSEGEIEKYRQAGFDVNAVNLQDLFIAMTCNTRSQNGEKV